MKYFGYYADSARADKANCTLAAVNKMDYIADVIANITGAAEIISFSSVADTIKTDEYIALREGVWVKYFNLKPHKNRIIRVLSRIIDKIKFLVWILKNVSKSETVIVYHSLGYFGLINLAHRLKKFRLVFEVEEIYSDVIGNKRLRKKEVKILKSAEAYIFPTKLLSNLINKSGKPEAIIHGTYKAEPAREKIFNDGKIHIVYAGTLDPRKGGAAATAAGEFLPEKYHIHILGFGSDEEIRNIKTQIAEVSKKSRATVTYDGLLSGEEYIRFIQSCDIGLSTQNPDADFNATSFPSKVLSYMANGLRVVSVRIPAIEQSAVGDMLYYYNNQTPEEIANAIMAVDIADGYNGKSVIAELDKCFTEDIETLLGEKG